VLSPMHFAKHNFKIL